MPTMSQVENDSLLVFSSSGAAIYSATIIMPFALAADFETAFMHSQTFRTEAVGIAANADRHKVVVSQSTENHAEMNGDYGITSAQLQRPPGGATWSLIGDITITLACDAMSSVAAFAGVLGHELKHELDVPSNPAQAHTDLTTSCACPGNKVFEAAGYAAQAQIEREMEGVQ